MSSWEERMAERARGRAVVAEAEHILRIEIEDPTPDPLPTGIVLVPPKGCR
jgi:hypothetical protein